jgi:uncharacterized protein HemX
MFSDDQAPVDPRLANSRSAEFFSTSGWQACAGGAGVGILACMLGNPSNKAQCMLVSAAVLCGVGMGANYYMDYLRNQYANDEQRLDAMTADVRKDNQELRALTQSSRSVINDDKQKIAQIKKANTANQQQRSQAQRQLAQIDANTAFLRDKLANAQAKHQEWQKVAASQRGSGARIDALDAEINNMQQQITALQNEIDQLSQQRSSIRLG